MFRVILDRNVYIILPGRSLPEVRGTYSFNIFTNSVSSFLQDDRGAVKIIVPYGFKWDFFMAVVNPVNFRMALDSSLRADIDQILVSIFVTSMLIYSSKVCKSSYYAVKRMIEVDVK